MPTLKTLTDTELAEELAIRLSGLDDSEQKTALQALANDLQTHQIELEMQNRELRTNQIILEQARELYSDLYDFAPLSYISFDERGVIREINLTGAAMLGQVRSRLIGKPFSTWVEKGSISVFFDHLKRILQSETDENDDIKVNCTDGQTLDVRIKSVRYRDKVNNSLLCRSAILDITEINRVKNEALVQEGQLRVVTEALPVLVAYLDDHERHVFSNSRYAGCFDSTPARIVGQKASDVWGERYGELAIFLRASLSGMQRTIDITLPGHDNMKRYFSATLSPAYDSDNQVCGAIILIGDITDRVALEELDRRRMLDVAHFSRLGAMGEMASEIAHEINQPLTAISIYSDACRRSLVAGKISHEKVVQAFDNINQQAVRAGEVIQRIREFASRKELQRTELSVNDIINDILYLLRAEIGSHNIELVLDLKDDLPMVLADKILVEQVIINLARNSIEAMEMVDKSDRMLMLQSSLSRPDEIEISIRDTGPGLSSEKLELIFSPFYTTKDDGMGMGLAICQTIIHSHHGRLWAALNERGGTTLSFTLPVIHGGETNAT